MEATFQNLSESVKPMVDRAISNARFHGINLHHGVPNLANGDCAIEAIADNISTRPCFGEVFNGGSEYNRKNWMEEAEDLVFKFSGGAGMSPNSFHEQWSILKQSGNYEYELGDYVLAAIAHCTKKDILIFNTKAEGAFDPIFVVEASKIGNRPANTDIPVILAYDQVHFEGLVPDSDEDMEKTIRLKEAYLKNEYSIQKKDIPVFNSLQGSYAQVTKNQGNFSGIQVNLRKKVKDMTDEERVDYKHTKEKDRQEAMPGATQMKQSSVDEKIPSTLEEGGKKIKDMNHEEFKEYKRLKQKSRRERAREKDEPGFKKTRASEKAEERATLRDKDEPAFEKTRASKKAEEREIAKNKSEVQLKKERSEQVQDHEKRRKNFIKSIKRGRIY